MRASRVAAVRFRLGRRVVDLAAYRVNDEALIEQEVSLLRVLCDAGGQTVDTERLYREMEGNRAMPQDRAIDFAIDFAVRRLRRKLGNEGGWSTALGFRLPTMKRGVNRCCWTLCERSSFLMQRPLGRPRTGASAFACTAPPTWAACASFGICVSMRSVTPRH